MSEKDFWHLTLAQFNALAERYRDGQERADLRAGQICAVIANVNRSSTNHTFTAPDFFPWLETKPKEIDGDKLLTQLKMMAVAYGGTIQEN